MRSPVAAIPWRWLFWLALAAGSSGLLTARPAHAVVIERIVAIVGDQAILLSDLRERSRPFLVRIHQELPAGAQRNAAISQLYRDVLERMVDERVQERAANRARIAVTSQEIDDALTRIAAQNGLGVEELVAEAIRSGMSEQDYRREIRRQVLDAKLINLRVQGRIRVTEDDLREEYRRIVAEERQRQSFRIAWLHVAPLGGEEAQRARAERLVAEARAGADFAELVRTHSSDQQTRGGGGLLPPTRPGSLLPALDRAILALEVGEISAPLRVEDQLVIVKLMERSPSSLPGFKEARAELENRVYVRKMDQARRRWLDGLRRQAHVVIRL